MILHIARAADWRAAAVRGRYEAASLASEGFIHCSEPHQLVRVADARFRAQRDLVLLAIDPSRLGAELRYESCEGGSEPFPHVYGPIELRAVVGAHTFAPGPDGRFALPPALAAAAVG